MKFLLDQDVYAVTARFLTALGHDIVTASSIGLSTADDTDILRRAQDDGRILVTRDRDFGGLAFVMGHGSGILYLRITPSTIEAVHREVGLILARYGEADLQKAFVVVEPGRHRHRQIEE